MKINKIKEMSSPDLEKELSEFSNPPCRMSKSDLYFCEYYIGPKKPNILYHIVIFILITFAWIFFRISDTDARRPFVPSVSKPKNRLF